VCNRTEIKPIKGCGCECLARELIALSIPGELDFNVAVGPKTNHLTDEPGCARNRPAAHHQEQQKDNVRRKFSCSGEHLSDFYIKFPLRTTSANAIPCAINIRKKHGEQPRRYNFSVSRRLAQ
jgi:hypothetical protein